MSETQRLRAALARYAIQADFDYPAETPEFCGWWCQECRSLVEEDGTGHEAGCLIHGVNPHRYKGRAPRRHALTGTP